MTRPTMKSPQRLLKLFLFAVVLCAWLFSSTLIGQVISGDVVGTITDASGAAVPNVTVTAINDATGIKTTVTSNSAGEYRFTNLLAGTYTITATASGFGTTTLKNVAVVLNTTATQNIILQVSQVATSIEVQEAAVTIDTSTAQIQNTYTTKQIADLPVAAVGQGVLNLSLLDAGVTSSGGVGVGVGPSIGGQRPRDNNFEIDGIDNNSKSVTGPVVYLPNESIAEFTLLQNQFEAEYGHSSGGQFNTIVKGGTNQFHGTIYDYLQNRNLDAENQTFKNEGITQIPRYDQNHLGGNFGGPISKNKLFFFTSFEYNPLGQTGTPPSQVYAPTAAGYASLAAFPGINLTNLQVLQKYAVAPAVTAGGPAITVGTGANTLSVPTGALSGVVGPNFQNSYYGVYSMDYNISDTDQLRGRYIYNRQDTISTAATLPVFWTPVPIRFQLATLAEYHTFNPNLTNEFRVGYQRQNQTQPVGNQTFPGLDAFPNLQFNDLNLQVGPNPNYPQATINNLYQFSENITWIHGSHTFKFGNEFRDYISPESFIQSVRGNYEYTTVANYLQDTLPDFLATRAVGGRTYYGNQLASYSYIQDTWRVRHNLTVDLGLRYEYTTVPLGIQTEALNSIASVPGLLTFKAPSADPYGFGPRVGIAWTPTKSANTVIRAGFSRATDVIFDNVGLNAVPPEFYTLVTLTPSSPNAPLTNFLANGGITQAYGLNPSSLTAAAARAKTASWLPDQVLPYSLNYTLDVQHTFRNDYLLDVRYLGDRGVHLLQQQQINDQAPVTATENIPTFFSTPSAATLASLPLTVGQIRSIGDILPQYAAAGFVNPITAYVPQGWSHYNGLSVQLNKRLAHGLQYQVAYTWSHLIDDSTAEVASTFLTPRRAENFQNLTAEKADSILDRRQRFVGNFIYDAPWYKTSSNWLMKNLVGNWEIAPIYTYESPEYYTVLSGVDSNLNGDSAPDRTIVNLGGVPGTGSGVIGYTATGAQVKPTAAASQVNNVVAWVALNPNAKYIQAGPGAYANSGRNTQPTRPIDNIDLSIFKHFNITERMRLDLSGQFLNLFNHPQFIAGTLDTVNTTTSVSTSDLNFATASSSIFNNPTQAFSSNPRVIQVLARFNW
jgi:Carboxypeptidase regulatory-like domain